MATDFRRIQKVKLDPVGDIQLDPKWLIYNKGAEVVQNLNSDPGLAVGYNGFTNVDFEGTLYVDIGIDDDFIGFVFSFQSNRRFYAVTWKRKTEDYWGKEPFLANAKAGIEIKLIDSSTGPGEFLRNSLWHTGSTANQTKLLWKDPKNIGWDVSVAYRWHLIHRPGIGLINLKIFNGDALIIDSGNVYDSTLKGGRLGLYVFSQESVTWSNMVYKCNGECFSRKNPLKIFLIQNFPCRQDTICNLRETPQKSTKTAFQQASFLNQFCYR